MEEWSDAVQGLVIERLQCQPKLGKEHVMKTSIYALGIALMTAAPAFAQEANIAGAGDMAAVTEAEMGNMLMAQARTETQVIAALELQGYAVSDTRRSLLGRIIITAENEAHVREVVMSRATGEILSDRIVENLVSVTGDGKSTASADAGADSSSDGGGIDAGTSVDVGGSVSIGSDSTTNSGGVSLSTGGGASVSAGGGTSLSIGD